MRYLTIILITTFLQLPGCKQPSKISIEVDGALRAIMHEGEIDSKINLSSLSGTSNLYALGAVENLKGEIIIWNSQASYSQVSSDSIVTTNDLNIGAALLVRSEVQGWNEDEVSSLDLSGFENRLNEYAQSLELESFPFLLEGMVKNLNWHVIAWDLNDTVHTHDKHKTSGLHGSITNEPVRIVGFYSKNHKGVFTHHSTNIHMHVITADKQLVGHIDDLAIDTNMTLFIPKTDI